VFQTKIKIQRKPAITIKKPCVTVMWPDVEKLTENRQERKHFW